MRDLIVKNNITIIDAMKALNLTKEKCLIVVDEDGILLGTITDGDLRRSILKGNEFSTNIEKSFNKKPVVLKNNNYTPEEVNELLIKHMIDVLPVIDDQGRIANYITWLDVFGDQSTKEKKKNNCAGSHYGRREGHSPGTVHQSFAKTACPHSRKTNY